MQFEYWPQFADHVIRDVRYGIRVLRRSPVFTAVAILSLALGIGANAAIFQLIDTVRLRTLPIANPQELAEVRADGVHSFGVSEDVNSQITYPLWEQIRAHQSAFAAMFAWGNQTFLSGRGSEARRARGLWVSGDFFRVLGITPERGRLLIADDDYRGCGAGPVVVSHSFWQTYFGGRESVIGSTLTLLDQPFTVVGVTPAGFTGLEIGQNFDVAVPVCSAALWDTSVGGKRLDQRDYWWLTVMGRLKPDWTIARASEHLRALSPGFLEATVPTGYSADLLARYRSFRFGVIPAGRGVSRLREAHGTSLSLLLGLTGLVVLITCGNLATLMLARASAREREIAVRVAIGASRPRLVSQMLIESLLVAAGGAALAIPVAVLSGRTLIAFLDTAGTPVTLNLTADWRLVAFVGASAVLTSILFGLVPALRVSIVDPTAAMRQMSLGSTLDRHRDRARFQRGLVVGQIAVSLVLVVSALLFVQSFRNLTAIDTGFETDGTIAVSFLDLQSAALPLEQRVAFQQQLTAEIRSVPGVAAAAASTHVPLSGATWAHFFRVTGLTGNDRRVSRFTYVSPGYFEALKIPILSGRDFQEADNARSRRVMLINESFVRSHLGGLHPIGATVRTIAEAGYPETTYEIIGVVGNTKYADLREEPCWCDVPARWMPPIAFVPIAQNPGLQPWAPVIVRSGTSRVTSAIAQRVTRLNPAIAIQFIELKSQIRERLVAERMIAWLAGAFGVVAMVLVAVGLYGIIAYLTVSRRKEIGIRLSLGSTQAQIVMLVLRDNLWLLATGLAIGLPLAATAIRSASTLLFGLTPTDVPTLAGAACLLASTAALAGGIPAWRAAKVHPDVALRCD
jgi:putative ABC transport system permease protein